MSYFAWFCISASIVVNVLCLASLWALSRDIDRHLDDCQRTLDEAKAIRRARGAA